MRENAVILLPVYNPDQDIMDTFLTKLENKFANIVLINDGCSDEHISFFKKIKKNHPVLKHYRNLGKGRGIKNGINYILDNYKDVEVIITADCDGQHSVEDIIKCYESSLENQNSLILGVRNFSDNNVPAKSRYGNVITRNVLKVFEGVNVSDSQTGLRAMSNEVAYELMDILGERYEYETNVLIACRKKSIPIIEETIQTIYIENNRTSHFNPIKDSIKIYKLFSKSMIINFTGLILETIMFMMFLTLLKDVGSVTRLLLSLLCAKSIANIYIYILNQYINISKIFIEYILLSLILIFVTNTVNIILAKLIFDFIIFELYIIFYRKIK